MQPYLHNVVVTLSNDRAIAVQGDVRYCVDDLQLIKFCFSASYISSFCSSVTAFSCYCLLALPCKTKRKHKLLKKRRAGLVWW